MELDSVQSGNRVRLRPSHPRGLFSIESGAMVISGKYIDIPLAAEHLGVVAAGCLEILGKYVEPIENQIGSYALLECKAALVTAPYARPVVEFSTFTEQAPHVVDAIPDLADLQTSYSTLS